MRSRTAEDRAVAARGEADLRASGGARGRRPSCARAGSRSTSPAGRARIAASGHQRRPRRSRRPWCRSRRRGRARSRGCVWGGSSSAPARPCWTKCETCVLFHVVSVPSRRSHWATTPRLSSGMPDVALDAERLAEHRVGASAKARVGVADRRGVKPTATLVPHVGVDERSARLARPRPCRRRPAAAPTRPRSARPRPRRAPGCRPPPSRRSRRRSARGRGRARTAAPAHVEADRRRASPGGTAPNSGSGFIQRARSANVNTPATPGMRPRRLASIRRCARARAASGGTPRAASPAASRRRRSAPRREQPGSSRAAPPRRSISRP